MFKKSLILSALMLVGGALSAQTVIVQEDFTGTDIGGTDSGTNPGTWVSWTQGGGPVINTDATPAAYPSVTPSSGNASAGEVLQVDLTNDGDNGGVYLPITLTEGNIYQVDAATISDNPPTTNWLEIFFTTTQPQDGVDVDGTNGTLIAKNSSWACEDWDNTLLTNCDFGGVAGQFVVPPGSGTVQYYLVVKTGICCGGPATVVLDELTVTDLGPSGFVTPGSEPLDDDYNDGDIVNNYGGIPRGFAGGDPGGAFAVQDASMEAIAVDGEGTTGAAGDYALNFVATTPIGGANFIYFGGAIPLEPSEAAVDISSFDTLAFDMKLGNGSAPTAWIVRIEDNVTNPPDFNFNNIDLSGEFNGTNYVSVEISLADLASSPDGGVAAADYANATAITFANGAVTTADNEPTLFIDNLRIFNQANVEDWTLY